jgi:hypothetical protein
MNEPEHIKEIHRIREEMAKKCNFDTQQFVKMLRQARIKHQKSSPRK